MIEDKLKELGFHKHDNNLWSITNKNGGLFTLSRLSNTCWEATLQHNIWSYLRLTEDNIINTLEVLNVRI